MCIIFDAYGKPDKSEAKSNTIKKNLIKPMLNKHFTFLYINVWISDYAKLVKQHFNISILCIDGARPITTLHT